MNRVTELNNYLYTMCLKDGIRMMRVSDDSEKLEMFVYDNAMYTFHFDDGVLVSVEKDLFWSHD